MSERVYYEYETKVQQLPNLWFTNEEKYSKVIMPFVINSTPALADEIIFCNQNRETKNKQISSFKHFLN